MRRALFVSALFLGSGSWSCGGGGNNEPLVDPLALVTTSLPGSHIGDAYNEVVKAKGGVPPYTFSLVSGALPTGIDLTSNGALTGLAGSAGKADFSIKVTDTKGGVANGDFSIFVRPDPVEIGALNLPMGREGVAYEQRLIARGGIDPKTWSIGQGALPEGITLSTDGVLSGTPTEFGVFDFTVRVTDSEMMSADRPLHLTIISHDPMITTTMIDKARLGAPYQTTFAAEGGSPPYSWVVASGTVPEGMNLSTNGTLAGTPSVSGIFMLTIRVTDAGSRSDVLDVSLKVIAPLQITTTQLNQAIHGRFFSFSVQATGGEEPYSWTLTTGALPPGLNFHLNGLISGMTDQLGDYPLTVRVRDNEGFMQSAQFTLRVSDRFHYDATPMMMFPSTCTGTVVAFTTADLEVADSMQISDIDVGVDVTYPDASRLLIRILDPSGQAITLCGADNFTGCESRQMNLVYDDDGAQANRPDGPLSAYDGLNPNGRWRLILLVVNPNCATHGTINSFSLTIQDDRDATEYVAVRGFEQNNLVHEPFIHCQDPNNPGHGVPPNELFLSATLYSVGANGFREGGRGDDVAETMPFTWEWIGSPISGVTLSPDGYVVSDFATGQAAIRASSGSESVTYTLRVTPPDWNPGR